MMKKVVLVVFLLLLLSSCCNKNGNGPKLLFTLPTKDNMQGLTYYGHHFYIGFDMGNKGEIREYSSSGSLVKKSGLLDIGHTASLAYRKKDHLIYEANGGPSNPAKVHVINMDKGIIKTYDFSKLGHSALIAIDKKDDEFLLHTSSKNHHQMIFTFFSFGGTEKSQFSLPYQGVPQGLGIQNGKIYYYTDNEIMIMSFKGSILKVIHLKINGESEGLGVSSKSIYFGYHSPNRIYQLKKPRF